MDVTNPHDKFFKETFSHPEVVKALLVRTLAPEIVSMIDFESLKYDNTSYLSSDLKEAFSDMVIHADIIGFGIGLKIAILLEHKSYKDDYAILQLDEYIIKGYQKQKKEEGKLSLILPFVYYHGEEDWEFKDLKAFFTEYPAVLQRYIPHHQTDFINLQKLTETEIENFENQMLISSILMQKNRNNPERIFESIIRIIKNFDPYLERNFIKSIMVYSTMTSLKKDDLMEAIRILPLNVQKEMVTLAQQWIEEGMEKGIEKGMEKGKLEEKTEVVLKGFKNGLTISILSNLTDLDEPKIVNILRNASLID